MAKPGTPRWKQLFDAADRTLGARVNDFVRGENFAIIAGLATRIQGDLTARSERASRQWLHVMNLPAASDVNRLLAQIGLLEREVRDLRKQVEDQQALAQSTESNRKKVASNGVARQSRVRAHKNPS
jgi:hypothetical protein